MKSFRMFPNAFGIFGMFESKLNPSLICIGIHAGKANYLPFPSTPHYAVTGQRRNNNEKGIRI